MSDDDQDESTKREVPARKGWMAPTVGADTAVPPPRETLPPSLSISVFDPPDQRFVEKSELGRGGMGRVVEATDRALGRSVAIKQSLATQAVDLARFEREVRITAQLQHPSVIPILDVGRDPEGHPFYIMRKIEGEPLADRVMLAETVRDRVALVSSFLNAVDAAAYAHARRIIHRDIKPWNILLGPFGETLLIDWGIARELDDTSEDPKTPADTGTALTRLGVAQGTPGFLAPEQARGEVVDVRADVYSLGATLFYVLANKLPYGRISATEAIDHAASGKPPDFAEIPDEVPRELVAICVKAMAPEPEDRYAHAGELAADLRRFLAGQLVAAHDYSTGEKVMKWVRRHRIAVTVAALALVAVAVVSIVSVRSVIHDRDAAREARILAEERADDVLLDRARVLAQVDPTSSLATLRELRVDSPRWEIARSIIRSAILGGIERRIAHHDDFVRAVAISPDGKRVVSSGSRLELYDRETRRSTPLAALVATTLRWRDPRTIGYLADGIVGMIDVETGTSRQLAIKDAVQLEVAGGQFVVRTRDGAVLAGVDTVVDKGAVAVATRGTQIAILTASAITIVDGAARKVIALDIVATQGTIQLSSDGKRVAALIGNIAREWRLDSDDAPRQWSSFGELQYAGATLYARNLRGFYSLESATPTARLTLSDQEVSRLGAHIIPFDDGALLVSDRSDLVYVTTDGSRQFPHRAMVINSAAVARDGTVIVLATERDVVLLDLRLALPASFAVPVTTELFGASPSQALVRMIPVKTDPAAFVPGISLVDLDSHRVTALAPEVGLRPFVYGDLFGVTPKVGSVILWDASGKRVFERERVANFRVDKLTVYFADDDGVVWRQLVGGEPVRLGQLPIKATLPTGISAVRDIVLIDGEPILNVYDKPSARFFRASGEELSLGLPGFAPNLYAGRNGVWFAIDFSTGTLWRTSNGVARQIPFEHDPGGLEMIGDRLLVITKDSVICELDLDGHVLRTVSTPGPPPRTSGGAYYVVTTRGVDLIGRDGARGTVQLPGDVLDARSTGKRVVALSQTSRGKQLFVWTDPVPDDPGALHDYLGTLTNARLPTGSDALTWSP